MIWQLKPNFIEMHIRAHNLECYLKYSRKVNSIEENMKK